MPNTTNYNWATPADTDLVKDGAAAIRTLGSSADTTVKNLNPGTTAGDIDYYTSSTAKARVAIGTAGQVLRVNSGGTAPEWATTADQTPLTTKGDLFTFDTADARLGVGANGTVLTADSAQATGLKWAAASGGVSSWSLLNAGGTALTGATTITVSGISNQKQIFVYIEDGSSANTGSVISVRPNADSGLNYTYAGPIFTPDSTYSALALSATNTYSGGDNIPVGRLGNNAADSVVGGVLIESCDSTGWKFFTSTGTGNGAGTVTRRAYWLQGLYEASAAITSIQIVSSSGNFDAGTVYVFGGA